MVSQDQIVRGRPEPRLCARGDTRVDGELVAVAGTVAAPPHSRRNPHVAGIQRHQVGGLLPVECIGRNVQHLCGITCTGSASHTSLLRSSL